MNAKTNTVMVYTDGSCLGNPGAGGWAALIFYRDFKKELKGGEPHTTNNRMEMLAVVKALQWVKKHVNEKSKIEVYSDSRLVVKSMNDGWKRKTNLDVWAQLDTVITQLSDYQISWHWVKGHAENEYNNRVDELAVLESKKIQKKGGYKVVERKEDKTSSSQKCPHCGKPMKGVLSLLPDSEMIRMDCEHCGRYVKFAEKTNANIKQAKKRVLISNKQIEEVKKIYQKKGIECSDNELKKIKTWTQKEAEDYIDGDQTLF